MNRNEWVEARFGWAKKHSDALEAEYEAWFEHKPYSLEVQPNRGYNEYTFRLRVRDKIPDRWPFMISDIIHNLRSSLDNLAYNLAGSPKGKRGQNIQFPIIHPGRKGGYPAFKRSLNRLTGVRKEALAIIEGVQPYHGLRIPRERLLAIPGPMPLYPLSILNHMSNVDKHRTPHVGFAAVSEVTMASAIPPIDIVTYSGRLLEDNAPIALWKFAQPVKPKMDVHRPTATLVFAFEVPWGPRGYKIVPIAYLGFMIDLVERDVFTPLRRFMKK